MTRDAQPASFDVKESARRFGHYRWLEMRLFEVLGGWVATVPELEVKLRLGPHSLKHAWHADLWLERLPTLWDMETETLTSPANDAVVAFMTALADPATTGATIEKLVGVYRVLIPHKIAAYTHHLDHTSQLADGPTIRSLRFALADEMEDWREGEMLLQSLIGSRDDVERAARHQARLEGFLVESGGVAGPGSIGGGS